ncbi:ATP-grasp domain-containing protein [Pasteurella skyensis]|uniref:ATP-grasp domain-containing protein n=1 Tax=Phocoenobacter skyensis TaxID=97481 RepID=A0AAJ6P0T9_9PAST|nr:ATP-grasp domain-containing protein [Pasteurella skyensis]MDP8162125.1 ATP-grasp domain-containing protein [Pasteurella skyensis]MDP8170028.1 ATP-grasp domain-containing protein [Pasteurella skyensis]MDP8172984.1 ATP-grasp domain-containing protein [Pasteurella skyensis]MDP8175101.1 ATP-grasp domain-containing protein [Pasteurella skyensis]MDP8176751.1 ATP-grasp domain-containing protein [Pasteurella skyensis]
MKNIVIIGTDHYNTLGAVRMLGEIGIVDFEVIILNQKSKMIRWSKYVKKIYFFNDEQTVSFLNHREKKENKAIIVACGDMAAEICSDNYDILKDNYILPVSNKKGHTTFYMDKMQQKLLAQKVGFNVADGIVLNRQHNNTITKMKLIQYPCITKSISTTKGGKSDIFICRQEDDVLNAIKNSKSEELVVETLINKKNELCTFGVAIGNEIYIAGVAMYTNLPPNGDYGGCFDIFDDVFLSQYVDIQKMKSWVREINFQGVFCMEFVLDQNGKAYFMENNLRVSGFDYGMHKAGANLVKMWVEQRITRQEIKKTRCIVTMFDFKQQVLSKNLTLWVWFRQLLTCKVFFTWNKKDPLPLFGYFIDGIERKLKRLLKRV